MLRYGAIALALALLLACGGGSKSEPQSPLLRIGAGPADVWHTLSAKHYVQAAKQQKLGFVITEDRPSVQEADWRKGQKPQRFAAQAREWNKEICDAGMIHVVFGINWNMLPLRELSDEDFEATLAEWLRDYDHRCTWLSPVIEPDEGPLARAERWHKLAAAAWPGQVIVAGAFARFAKPGEIVDRHPGSVQQAYAFLRSEAIVITDGGPFVHPPSVFLEIPGLISEALARDVPFIWYTDRYAPGNQDAHFVVLEVLGRAARLALSDG